MRRGPTPPDVPSATKPKTLAPAQCARRSCWSAKIRQKQTASPKCSMLKMKSRSFSRLLYRIPYLERKSNNMEKAAGPRAGLQGNEPIRKDRHEHHNGGLHSRSDCTWRLLSQLEWKHTFSIHPFDAFKAPIFSTHPFHAFKAHLFSIRPFDAFKPPLRRI